LCVLSVTNNNSPEAIAANVQQVASTGRGELEVPSFKKYIQYCKIHCSPRLSEEAGEVLTSSYVKIRDDVRRQCIGNNNGNDSSTQAAIPITVRQLEALIRLSESLARMRLDSQVQAEDVTESLRLFRVSTMAANAVDSQSNLSSSHQDGNSSGGNRAMEEMDRTETFLRARLYTNGSIVNKQKLIEEAVGQGFNAVVMARVVAIMVARGEVMERNQGRLLKRIK
jgi:DNA replication licensing factor MCM5